MTAKCPHCGDRLALPPDLRGEEVRCGRCLERFVARPRKPAKDTGTAAAAVAFGAASAVTFLCPPVGGAFALAGVLLGVAGLKTSHRKLAVVGLVLSSVGLLYAAGFLVLFVAGAASADPPGNP